MGSIGCKNCKKGRLNNNTGKLCPVANSVCDDDYSLFESIHEPLRMETAPPCSMEEFNRKWQKAIDGRERKIKLAKWITKHIKSANPKPYICNIDPSEIPEDKVLYPWKLVQIKKTQV